MKKIALTFGLAAGAILSVMMLATLPFADRIGFDRLELTGYTTMVLSFLLIFFGIRSYRENVAGGSLTFGRGFRVGALIALVASVCYVATWQVIYYAIAPDFMEKYAAHTIEKERAGGASEASLAETRAQMEKFSALYRNPLINVGVTFLEVLPLGLIVSVVAAGILRQRPEDQAGARAAHRGGATTSTAGI